MSPNRVFLVPVDFEAASLAAVRTALELARPLDARVVILHAYHLPPYVYSGMPAEVRKRICQQAADLALEPLDELSKRWGVRGMLREGDPAEHILQVAKELGAERIVMGTHGRRGVDRLLVGSVAEAVVRRSPVPVMTVRADEPQTAAADARSKRVLCAVDLEPASRQVVALARAFAGETGASLELVHAVASPFYVYPTFDPILARDLDVEVRHAAGQALGALVSETGAARYHLLTGDTGKCILELVEQVRPVALVLGTHGRRGAARLFLGSVAEWLLRRSPVPVLTARVQEIEAAAAGAGGSKERADSAA